MLEPGADPVRKVSIVPRGRALGVTFQSPSSDRYGYDADYLRGPHRRARSAAAPPRSSSTARSRPAPSPTSSRSPASPARWSGAGACREEIGLVTVVPDDVPPTPASARSRPARPRKELVDREVRRIVEECYGRALDDLREHRDQLDSLARALLEHETLDEADAYAAAGFERGRAPGDEGPRGMAIAERSDTPSPDGGGAA